MTLPHPDDNDDNTNNKGTTTATTTRTTTTWPSIHVLEVVPTLISLSLFSYLGQFLRYFTETLFGSACHRPGSVGWDAGNWAPCTTDPGTTSSTGGALFIDLPANVLGCFVMGLMVSGEASMIGMPFSLPVAMISRHHPFQNCKLTHLGIRTGFCGALTTFASWNTQMVVMLIGGTKGTAMESSQWVSVLWGYLIGYMVAIQAYAMGRDVAIALSRKANPVLTKEANALLEQNQDVPTPLLDLPDFERRFLYDIILNEPEEHPQRQSEEEEQLIDDNYPHSYRASSRTLRPSLLDSNGHISLTFNQKSPSINIMSSNKLLRRNSNLSMSMRRQNSTATTATENNSPENLCQKYGCSEHDAALYSSHIQHLSDWKSSTHRHRTGSIVYPNYLERIHQLEVAILVGNEEPPEELFELAREEGWNVEALQYWKRVTSSRRTETATMRRDGEKHKDKRIEDSPVTNTKNSTCHSDSVFRSWEFLIHAVLFTLCTSFFIWGTMHFSDITSAVERSYRSQFLSALLAPPGTILRWVLGRWNGRIPEREWFPLGTFVANVVASIISALAAALAIQLKQPDPSPSNLLIMAFLDAIKSGFAGSLSTVSTFVAETVGLFQVLPRYFWGYYYSMGTIVAAAIVGIAAYAWAAV